MLSISNISGYGFIHLSKSFLSELKVLFMQKTKCLELKGTILLSEEGINLFLSGQVKTINCFQDFLLSIPYFKKLVFKTSFSNFQPFKKMLVKIKKEIIPFGIANINPEKHAAPYITPETLKSWLKTRFDLVLLDTRNSFEVEFGTFENSLQLGIKNFRDFPKNVHKLDKLGKNLPIITFCTGGIRCEKASTFLLSQGFNNVYQLEGGILNYFEKCGGGFYKGLCFVFDERKVLTPSLKVFVP